MKHLKIRYVLTNYGGHQERLFCSTLKEVHENTRGEFSICTDLLTNEVFEPYEKL